MAASEPSRTGKVTESASRSGTRSGSIKFPFNKAFLASCASRLLTLMHADATNTLTRILWRIEMVE
jgi:hypothetical protein